MYLLSFFRQKRKDMSDDENNILAGAGAEDDVDDVGSRSADEIVDDDDDDEEDAGNYIDDIKIPDVNEADQTAKEEITDDGFSPVFVNTNEIPKSEVKDESIIEEIEPKSEVIEGDDIAAQFEDFGDDDFGEDVSSDDHAAKKRRKKEKRQKKKDKKKKKKDLESDSDNELITKSNKKRSKIVYESDDDDDTVTMIRGNKKAHFETEKYRPDDPEISIPITRELKKCALRCGLPGKFFSIGEQNAFRSSRTEAEVNAHLTARNTAMFLWDRNPFKRLYVNTLRRTPSLAKFKNLVPIFNYLEETGVVNVGTPSERFESIPNGRSVTIIGAGLSGLVAAQQLRRAGFTVNILEGWSDIGGRCRNNVISEELSVSAGPQNRFDLPQMVIEYLEELAGVITIEPGADEFGDERPDKTEGLIPLTASLDNIQRETTASQATDASTAERAAELNRDPTEPQQVLLSTLLRQAGIEETWWYDQEKKEANPESEVQMFIFDPEGKHVDIIEVAEKIQESGERLQSFLNETIKDEDTHEACISYLESTSSDLTPSTAQIISTWEQDTHSRIDKVGKLSVDREIRREKYSGNKNVIKKSWNEVCRNLSQGISIKTNTIINSIKDNGNKVEIESTEGEIFESDFCMVTVPIGVLKNKSIKFEPELPAEKEEAIEKIGAGRRNTLVMSFAEAWWKGEDFEGEELESGDFIVQSTDKNLRGIGSRGQFELEPHPHIIFSLSGQSAEIAEDAGGDIVVVDHAMQQLRKSFPNKTVPEPDTAIVSNWGTDPLALCSAPFCKPETKIEHFTTLAKPFGRIAFAGDATDPECFGMLLGAAHSGVRVARDVIIKNRSLTESGKGSRPRLTPQQRAVQIAMMGAAPALVSVEQGTPSPGKGNRDEIGIDFDDPLVSLAKDTQRSLGSSTNLAAKYAKIDKLPYMQRSLFNSKRDTGDSDALDRTRAGYHNIGYGYITFLFCFFKSALLIGNIISIQNHTDLQDKLLLDRLV